MNISIKDSMFQWIGVSITTILIANTLWADTIHVPGDYTTIQEAIDAASAGDTVVVGPGKYEEIIVMKTGVSLLGSGPHRTTIKSPDGDSHTILAASNSFIEGFTVERRSGTGYPILVSNFTEIWNFAIRNNIIVNYGTRGGDPIAIISTTSSTVIEKNFVVGFELGIYTIGPGAPIIRNNIVKGSRGILGLNGAKIINNTVIPGTFWGIETLARDMDSANVYNNIIYSATGNIWQAMKLPGNTDYGYNNQWNFLDYEYMGIGGISADPLFMDPENDIYILDEGSPSIDAGNPDPQYNDVDGTRNDMGAYGGPDPISGTITTGLKKSISISEHSGYPGDTINVDVKMNNPIGLQSAIFQIGYDHNILIVNNVSVTSTTEDFSLNANFAVAGQIDVELNGDREINGGSGSLLNIQFIVKESARSGDVSPIRFISVILNDGFQQPIELEMISDGIFVVNLGSEDGNYLYVDSQNDQVGDGSRMLPFTSIQEGIQNASSGDTIVVVGGEYAGPLVMKEDVYLRGAGAQVTIIRGGEDPEPTVKFDSVSFGEISGFTIYGPMFPTFPVIEVKSSSPRIINNRIEFTVSSEEATIEVLDLSNPVIEHNAIIKSGLRFYNSAGVVKGNLIEGSDMGGITLALFDSSNVTVSNNVILGGRLDSRSIIVDNGSSTSIIGNKIVCGKEGGDCIRFSNADSIEFFNNLVEDILDNANGIIIRNSTGVILANNIINTGNNGIDENLSEMRAYNNIITGAANYGITASITSEIDYNDLWNNVNDYNIIAKGEHDISEDPIFINLENHDYRLGVGSPAIDAGHPGIEYNDRDGTRNDMGIFGGPYADTTGIFKVGPVLSIPNISGARGDTVEIQLIGTNVEGITNIVSRISFNSDVLSYLEMKTANLTEAFSLTRKTISSEIIEFSLQSTTGLRNAEGTLLYIYFIISERPESNATTIVKFNSAAVYDELAILQTNLRLENGEVTITPVGVIDDDLTPSTYNLSHNYPNPFNPVTMIEYSLPSPGKVSLIIYNLLGQEIGRLVDSEMPAGDHIATWNATNYASGIYFYRLQAGDYVETHKMVLLK